MTDPASKRISVVARRAALGFPRHERARLRELRAEVRDSVGRRDNEAALAHAIEAADLSNEVFDIQILALLLSRLQRWKQAAPLWIALGKAENVPPRSQLLAARALFRAGKLQASRAAFQRRLDSHPGDKTATGALALISDRLAAEAARRKALRAEKAALAAKPAGRKRIKTARPARKPEAKPAARVFRGLDAALTGRAPVEPKTLDA